MNTSKIRSSLIAATILLAGPALSQALMGSDLLQRLTSESPQHRAVAIGYIAGVSDIMEGSAFCAPPEATVGQAAVIVARTLAANPQLLAFPAAALVGGALQIAWPCEQQPSEQEKQRAPWLLRTGTRS